METPLIALGWIFTLNIVLLFFFSKAFFLASSRLGWLMLLSNLVYEVIERRLRVPRLAVDFVTWLTFSIASSVLGGPWFGSACAITGSAAWIGALVVELRWRSDSPATQDRRTRRVPLPIPRLIVNIRGPVLARSRRLYDLGHWPEGWHHEFEVLVLNPGLVRPQLPMTVSAVSDSTSVVVAMASNDAACPEPGQATTHQFTIRAETAGTGGNVTVSVSHGDRTWQRSMRIASIIATSHVQVRGAEINRWKYGCRAGFAWRGDNDLYDPSTFQSPQGLRIALGLAARYRMPTTIMLSARLSLEQEEHRAFCEKFGWDRHSEEVPDFARFFHEEVDMTNEQEFPTTTSKPFSAEIGNHMYLHYGTHAAADPGNNWAARAKIGAGNYPWMRAHPCSSFEEQRDNLLKCAESTRQHLGVETTCFAIPSDVYDADTSRAVEAAGIEVGNDTDTTKFQRQVLFPPEHHPTGCERLAELTRMSPRDPVTASQIAMLKFWIGFSRRNRRALVYLAHHHLLMYETNACFDLTSELLRYTLADTEGDVYAATVTALGRYWRDVLSVRTRCVNAKFDAREITISNQGSESRHGLPLVVSLGRNRSFMVLVNVEANASTSLKLTRELNVSNRS